MCCSKAVRTASVLRARPLRSYVPLRRSPSASAPENNTYRPAYLFLVNRTIDLQRISIIVDQTSIQNDLSLCICQVAKP